ncbi:tRNA (adenine(22)-N(1))-methyltransferase [Streptococcus cameli]
MEYKISRRLETVADFVPKGARLADIGSDHAYLPLFLLKKNQIDFAVAGEVVDGPYQSALRNVAQEGFSDQVAVRLASGLAAIQKEDQIDTITICGMGGRLIATILATDVENRVGVQRLILQPNNREDELRVWLQENGFAIVHEAILTENQKNYEILVVEPGEMFLSEKEKRFGPFLIKEQSPVFVAKWQKELFKLEVALKSIPTSHADDRAALQEKINMIKEVLHVS